MAMGNAMQVIGLSGRHVGVDEVDSDGIVGIGAVQDGAETR